jgi:uncharacterized membrane protein YeaQ/YmgE (transglycosylase-associated protein family)
VEIVGVWSALAAGIVIGLLGRMLAPGRRPLGCLLTLTIGIVGAVIGTAIGVAIGVGFWLTLLLQVVAAALIVTFFGLGLRRR